MFTRWDSRISRKMDFHRIVRSFRVNDRQEKPTESQIPSGFIPNGTACGACVFGWQIERLIISICRVFGVRMEAEWQMCVYTCTMEVYGAAVCLSPASRAWSVRVQQMEFLFIFSDDVIHFCHFAIFSTWNIHRPHSMLRNMEKCMNNGTMRRSLVDSIFRSNVQNTKNGRTLRYMRVDTSTRGLQTHIWFYHRRLVSRRQ